MQAGVLVYGANGFVGEVIARLAVEHGLQPILAGRNAGAIERLARALGTAHRVFSVDDASFVSSSFVSNLLTGLRFSFS